MSKKHKNFIADNSSQATRDFSHESEYRIIKFDLIKVLILNAVYLGLIFTLYFANQKSHVVDNWFAKLLHF